ncbi:MAG: hypothetical protein ACLTYN_09465 [Dysosmobacter welbionis]
MLDYQEERADWIFQKFEMNPDDYNYAWFYELSSYVGTDAFVTIFDIIDLPAGATSDSYFVNNAMDTVYCVFQDKDAVNYLYEFTKEDDVWQLSKVETRQDEGKYSKLSNRMPTMSSNCSVHIEIGRMAIRNITDSHSFYKRLYVDCPGELWYSASGRENSCH